MSVCAGLLSATVYQNLYYNFSLTYTPKGWTSQEVAFKWMEKDFEPQSAAWNKSNGWQLLALDGHNSHCTYRFCQFAEQHHILIVCLPLHSTHAL